MFTSGKTNFWNTKNQELITEAYERIGLLPDLIDAQKIQTAIRAANLLLTTWLNRGLNLWTVKQDVLNLVTGKNTYVLSRGTQEILEASIRTAYRRVGGTPFASSGDAFNAFDENPLTACTQTSPDGFIGYDFGVNGKALIDMVGITSETTLSYQIEVQCSEDNIEWVTVAAEESYLYRRGLTRWITIPSPSFSRYIRIQEVGGATLNIQELYFDIVVNDQLITPLSRMNYVALPQKNQLGRPTSFWLDRQIDPILYVWPTPIPEFRMLYYTYTQTIEDFGDMENIPEIPARFYDAFCCGLALNLSTKFAPDRHDLLSQLYQKAFDEAARRDVERVPLRIYGSFMSCWLQP